MAIETVVDNVDVEATWQALESRARSQLIDVRTRAEWTYVGIPDLGSTGLPWLEGRRTTASVLCGRAVPDCSRAQTLCVATGA